MRLGLDTAGDRAAVALQAADGTLWTAHVDGARRHASALLPLIDGLLRDSGLALSALGHIVVADGPGSFTGLRVGVAVAKALARVTGAELWTTPSLLGRAHAAVHASAHTAAPLAMTAPALTPGASVIAATDALRGDIYAAVYRFPRGRVEVVRAPGVCRPAELRASVARPALLAAAISPASLAELDGWAERTVVPPEASPRAESLLALLDLADGARRVDDVLTWEPEYGRPAEAQARWEQAHGRPLASAAGGPA
jgi:tRNA threonylcarbamoyladenosine biosynthesis protein TsaB